MCLLEQTRADEIAPLLHPEQLLLHPLGRHPRGADDLERRIAAVAPAVELPCGDLLAHPRRSLDQHPAAGRGDSLEGRTNVVDRPRTAGEIGLASSGRAQRRHLAAQPLGFGRAGDHEEQAFGLEGLLDEVGGPAADRGDGGVEVAVTGDHQHRDRRVSTLDLVEQVEPVEPRSLQPDVEQY